jgi:hypothetical protein
MAVAVLLRSDDACELVSHDVLDAADCGEPLLHPPLHRVPLSSKLHLLWSSRHYAQSEVRQKEAACAWCTSRAPACTSTCGHTPPPQVNELASRAASQLIKGDALLVVAEGAAAHTTDLAHLLAAQPRLQHIHSAMQRSATVTARGGDVWHALPAWHHQPWGAARTGHAHFRATSAVCSRPACTPKPAAVKPESAPQEPVPWQELDAGVLGNVCLLLPRSASALQPMLQVCSAWRQVRHTVLAWRELSVMYLGDPVHATCVDTL